MRIAMGTTRIVLLIGPFAIKVPYLLSWKLFLWGLLANMQERQFSRIGHIKMCPVLFSLPGGFLCVMRRATPLTVEEFEALEPAAWRDEGDFVIPVEAKVDSFGWLDGRVVAIDYGSDYTYD